MDIAGRLAALQAAHLHRLPLPVDSPQGREALVDGRHVLLFCSNSYLALNTLPCVRRAAVAALRRYGAGAGGSRLVSGNLRPHLELEAAMARFKGSEAALLFTSGYTANLGILSALCGPDTYIFSDARNHASIIDGCRLSRAKVQVYAHNDPDDLQARIRRCRPREGLIVTDAVFSMDGDVARLPELAAVARRHGLPLLVDDAHATGVLGDTGRGSLEHFGLTHDEVPLVMATLSKALPGEGGMLCASAAACDLLRSTARPYLFTTALSPATVAAAQAGVDYLLRHPERVRRLRRNTARLRRRLAAQGIDAPGETPIVPIMVGDEARALAAAERLLALGVFAPCIRYPTVARGQARLRLTVSAAHTGADLDFAADCVARIL